MTKVPPIFVSHGTPKYALDRVWGKELRDWIATLPRPRAILVVSAQWQEPVATRGSTKPRLEMLHDYHAKSFPPDLASIVYRPPGAPELAYELHQLATIARAPDRGLDHGAWTPLVHMFPDAEVPVLELSLVVGASARRLYGLGRRIGRLAERGYLLMGSGALTHGTDLAEDAAREFDAWIANMLADSEMDQVLSFRARAPHARLAHPTSEHIDPLFVICGAASLYDHSVGFPIRGFDRGSVSRRCVQFGR